ncbi:MAG: hypothetical protein H7837_01910 [Magnetococcus sp. MYC-9]
MSLLLCLILSLALWSGRWGLAGLYAYPARMLLDGWDQPTEQGANNFRHPQEEERWQIAMTTLAKARRLEPNNADLHFLTGRLHHQHALLQSPWTAQAKVHWHQAILAYQQALQLRPTWGYQWILLAQARLQAGEPATQILADWMRAIRFAPHARDVQLTAIRIGFALWTQMDVQQQALVDTLTKRAMPSDGEEILLQAAKYNLLQRLQPFLEDNPQWQNKFNSLSKNR